MPSDANTPNAEPIDVDLSKVTVLVVEDEEVILDVTCAFLSKIGVKRAIAVRNAEDAIFQLEDDEHTKIDIVLVDLMLPGASGLALIKTIREHKRERLQKMPVVVVTSYTSMKVYRKAAEFDINGFLRKPIAPGSLEVAITKALGGKVSAKAMANYRSDQTPERPEPEPKKKPGFFASLFGLDESSKPQQPAQQQPAKKAPPPRINRSA